METPPRSCLPCANLPAFQSSPHSPAPVGTLSSSRKMGTMMKRMMRRVWIMIMPSFSVFRRFSWSNVLNPGIVGQGIRLEFKVKHGGSLDTLGTYCPAALLGALGS